MSKLPTTPKDLSAAGKRLWRKILADWPIVDAAHLEILREALLARDRAESCRRQINEVGELVVDRFNQQKPNPLLPHERDARSAFIQGIKALGLDPSEV